MVAKKKNVKAVKAKAIKGRAVKAKTTIKAKPWKFSFKGFLKAFNLEF